MRAVSILLCVISFVCPVMGQDGCDPCPAFCQPCPSQGRGFCCDGSTVGAIVLGAGAGALAGWAASSDGHRHHRSGCRSEKDKRECLQLNYTFFLDVIEESAIATVTPFATLPNNRILLGAPKQIVAPDSTNEVSLESSICVDEPLFGKYQLGVLIKYEAGTNPSISELTATLKVEAKSSHFGTSYVFAEQKFLSNLFDLENPVQELIAGYTYFPAK